MKPRVLNFWLNVRAEFDSLNLTEIWPFLDSLNHTPKRIVIPPFFLLNPFTLMWCLFLSIIRFHVCMCVIYLMISWFTPTNIIFIQFFKGRHCHDFGLFSLSPLSLPRSVFLLLLLSFLFALRVRPHLPKFLSYLLLSMHLSFDGIRIYIYNGMILLVMWHRVLSATADTYTSMYTY